MCRQVLLALHPLTPFVLCLYLADETVFGEFLVRVVLPAVERQGVENLFAHLQRGGAVVSGLLQGGALLGNRCFERAPVRQELGVNPGKQFGRVSRLLREHAAVEFSVNPPQGDGALLRLG